jgi:hypothetical protein
MCVSFEPCSAAQQRFEQFMELNLSAIYIDRNDRWVLTPRRNFKY